jgi:hypothetical protein
MAAVWRGYWRRIALLLILTLLATRKLLLLLCLMICKWDILSNLRLLRQRRRILLLWVLLTGDGDRRLTILLL